MVNFKTRKQSYRSKKKLENPPDQWKIFENTHEAIIDEETLLLDRTLHEPFFAISVTVSIWSLTVNFTS